MGIIGAEKALQILDMKTWKSRIKWRTPCKYDAVYLLKGCSKSGNANNNEQVYIAGRDNELLLCEIPLDNLSGNQKKRKRNEKTVDHPVAPESTSTDLLTDEVKESVPSGSLSNVSKLRLSHHRGVRAESYWCGLDITTTTSIESSEVPSKVGDRIIGICGKGKVYVIENSQLMRVARDDGQEDVEN